jgi:hypothetical protein
VDRNCKCTLLRDADALADPDIISDLNGRNCRNAVVHLHREDYLRRIDPLEHDLLDKRGTLRKIQNVPCKKSSVK